MYHRLKKSIEDATAIIGIIGLGYVGLPLVRVFLSAGFRILGFDGDQRKVEQSLAGHSYIGHIAAEQLKSHIENGKFEPTAKMQRLSEADMLLICVPTPLTDSRDPDLTFVKATPQQIATVLRPGQLIILESTT